MCRAVVRVGLADDGQHYVAVCSTGRCTWRSATHVVKAGAVEEARWHREHHRQCRELAETSTRHGHFRPPAGALGGSNQATAWVPCPVCRHHVTTAFVAWAKDREIERLLVDAVEEHLLDADECEGRRR
jgi:hypothetical protein